MQLRALKCGSERDDNKQLYSCLRQPVCARHVALCSGEWVQLAIDAIFINASELFAHVIDYHS